MMVHCRMGREVDFNISLVDSHLVRITKDGGNFLQRQTVCVWEPYPHRNGPKCARNDEAKVEFPTDGVESCTGAASVINT